MTSWRWANSTALREIGVGAHDIVVSVAGTAATLLRSIGPDRAGVAGDGTTLAWVEGGRLVRSSYDGSLRPMDVRALEPRSSMAWLGGGYYLRPEPPEGRFGIYRLSDGARAELDTAMVIAPVRPRLLPRTRACTGRTARRGGSTRSRSSRGAR